MRQTARPAPRRTRPRRADDRRRLARLALRLAEEAGDRSTPGSVPRASSASCSGGLTPPSTPSCSSSAGTGRARARRRPSRGTTSTCATASLTSWPRTTSARSVSRRRERPAARSSCTPPWWRSCAICVRSAPSRGSPSSRTSTAAGSRRRPSGTRGSGASSTVASATEGSTPSRIRSSHTHTRGGRRARRRGAPERLARPPDGRAARHAQATL